MPRSAFVRRLTPTCVKKWIHHLGEELSPSRALEDAQGRSEPKEDAVEEEAPVAPTKAARRDETAALKQEDHLQALQQPLL